MNCNLLRDSFEYFELGGKTHYSFLSAVSDPRSLVLAAKKYQYRGIALIDHGGVYGLPKAWDEARNIADFSLIVGSEIEIRISDYQTIYLSFLCRNRAAYAAMCTFLTQIHQRKEEHKKGRAEIFLPDFLAFIEKYPEIKENIWMVHPLDSMRSWRDRGRGCLSPLWVEWIAGFEKILNATNQLIYFSFYRREDGLDDIRQEMAQQMLFRFRDRVVEVVSHRPTMIHAEDSFLMDVFRGAKALECLENLGSDLPSSGLDYLLTRDELIKLYSDKRVQLQETVRIGSQCLFRLSELKYAYPVEWIPEGLSADAYLRQLCKAGIPKRYKDGKVFNAESQALLEKELSMVQELKFADYFLTVYDIVSFARSKSILCQGRGSAANSIICYLLEITAIDPVEMKLLFERFISVERGEPPDIDVDFEHDRREEVIQYIYNKFGRDRAAMVSAVVTFQSRSAFREIAKTVGIPVGTESARKVRRKLEETTDPVLKEKFLKAQALCDQMDSKPRHLSIHSGGFIVSHTPLLEMVPIEKASMDGRTIIQWDKYDLDILGLLKIDVLALGMLAALKKGLDLAGLQLHEIPHNDPKTYQMIQRADTIGTFQIESRAQMSMLPRLKPQNFYDLVIEVALVRPGPIVGDMVHPYLRRRRGLEKFVLPDKRLEPILGRTLGVPIFQEQIMKMAITLADFTPGEADQLRRAIGAWRSAGSIDQMGRRLAEGLKKAGLPEDFSQQIFRQIQGFSEYGFPESHAASFALIAYASCYLKCHYPEYFLCAMLNSQPLGFYAPHTLIDDAKRHGVEVLPVDLICSDRKAIIEGNKCVRLGFESIIGIKAQETDSILQARQERTFESIRDLKKRTDLSLRTLRRLAMAGVLDALAPNRRSALWQILAFDLELAQTSQKEIFQQELFKDHSLQEKIKLDYQYLGHSTLGHPMKFLRERLGSLGKMHSQSAKSLAHKSPVVIVGLAIVMQRPPTAKGTAFATLEDEHGLLDLILWKDVYENCRELLLEGSLVRIEGIIQRDGLSVSMLVKRVTPCARVGLTLRSLQVSSSF